MNNNKEKIKRAFSRSARTYDSCADIQKSLTDVLSGYLNWTKPATVLELGCATGNYTLQLASRFAFSPITSVDFSREMIQEAQLKLAKHRNIRFICTDVEVFLSNVKDRFDLITSNSTLHWFSDLNRAIDDVHRLLTDKGMVLYSLFGPRTLNELNFALNHIFNDIVVLPANNFPSRQYLHELSKKLFDDIHIREIIFSRSYSSSLELLRHLKKTGVTGKSPELPSILTRNRLRKVDEWFFKNYGKCAVTYQVFIFRGVKKT